MTEHLRIGVEAGVMTLTLARADKKNALNDELYSALADALAAAEADDAVRVVLLAAEGDAFTAGSDIGDFARAAAGEVDFGARPAFRFIRGLAAAEKPLVAAVQGLAVGIGLTMLLHFDLVYIADDARLTAPFVNLALAPEASSSLLLPSLVGHKRAFATFVLGEPIVGAEAVALGLANAACPRDEVFARALAAAQAVAARSSSSVKATKRLMRDSALLLTQIEREGEAFKALLSGEDAKAAFRAFAERRR